MNRYRVSIWPPAVIDISVDADNADDAIDVVLDIFDPRTLIDGASFEVAKVDDERA